jgi:hypothetical protein
MAREKVKEKARTIEEYKLAVATEKQLYQMDKINYNWNYKFIEETLEDGFYFMIANYHKATKIIFDNANQVLIEKTMYTMDVKTMTDLQNQLKQEQN